MPFAIFHRRTRQGTHAGAYYATMESIQRGITERKAPRYVSDRALRGLVEITCGHFSIFRLRSVRDKCQGFVQPPASLRQPLPVMLNSPARPRTSTSCEFTAKRLSFCCFRFLLAGANFVRRARRTDTFAALRTFCQNV